MSSLQPQTETDPRFPSGRWTGFWIQKFPPVGRHPTELFLTFRDGVMTGEGRDRVGDFVVEGEYDLDSGKCFWVKTYVGQHSVDYAGFNEGKGIWGTWSIKLTEPPIEYRGGFHIWPEGMLDPSNSYLSEQAEIPIEREKEVKGNKPVMIPCG